MNSKQNRKKWAYHKKKLHRKRKNFRKKALYHVLLLIQISGIN